MKKVSKSVFFIALLLVTVFCAVTITGVYTNYGDVTTTVFKGAKEIVFDKDGSDSATIVLTPEEELSAEQLRDSCRIVASRLQSLGYINDMDVAADEENGQIVITMPFSADNSAQLSSIATLAAEQGVFELREGNETDDDGNPSGATLQNVIATYSNLSNTQLSLESNIYGNGYIYKILTKLDSESQTQLKELTADATSDNPVVVSYWLDGTKVATNSFSEPFTGGQLTIYNSSYTNSDTYVMYLKMVSGPHDVGFKTATTISYPAADGTDYMMSLTLAAAVIALFIYLIVSFRFAGCAAAIAIALQCGVEIAMFSGVIEGYSGVVLTLGNAAAAVIAVCASAFAFIYILTKIKNECRGGLSYAAAIDNTLELRSARPLVAYAVAFVCALAARLLLNPSILYATAYYADTYTVWAAAKHIVYEVVAAFFAMIIFRLVLRSTASFGGFALKQVSSDAKKTSVPFAKKAKQVIAIVCVVAVAALVAGFVTGGAWSTEKDGVTVVTRSFVADAEDEDATDNTTDNTADNTTDNTADNTTDNTADDTTDGTADDTADDAASDDTSGESETAGLASENKLTETTIVETLAALSGDISVRFGATDSGTTTIVSVFIPANIDLTAAEVNAALDEQFPDRFTEVNEYTTVNEYSMTYFAVVAAVFAAVLLLALIFARLFTGRVKKQSVFLALLLAVILAVYTTAAVCFALGVPVSSDYFTLLLAALVFAVFAASWSVYDAASRRTAVKSKQLSVSDTVELAYDSNARALCNLLIAVAAMCIAAAVVAYLGSLGALALIIAGAGVAALICACAVLLVPAVIYRRKK